LAKVTGTHSMKEQESAELLGQVVNQLIQRANGFQCSLVVPLRHCESEVQQLSLTSRMTRNSEAYDLLPDLLGYWPDEIAFLVDLS